MVQNELDILFKQFKILSIQLEGHSKALRKTKFKTLKNEPLEVEKMKKIVDLGQKIESILYEVEIYLEDNNCNL